MSSIVIFILFIVVSMIFQAIKQQGSGYKRPTTSTNPNRPTIQPTVVAPHKSPSDQNADKMQSNRMQSSTDTLTKTVSNVQSGMNQERVRFMGSTDSEALQAKKVNAESIKETDYLDIDIEDLQRSIIMSEVLGKPKALKNNSR